MADLRVHPGTADLHFMVPDGQSEAARGLAQEIAVHIHLRRRRIHGHGQRTECGHRSGQGHGFRPRLRHLDDPLGRAVAALFRIEGVHSHLHHPPPAVAADLDRIHPQLSALGYDLHLAGIELVFRRIEHAHGAVKDLDRRLQHFIQRLLTADNMPSALHFQHTPGLVADLVVIDPYRFTVVSHQVEPAVVLPENDFLVLGFQLVIDLLLERDRMIVRTLHQDVVEAEGEHLGDIARGIHGDRHAVDHDPGIRRVHVQDERLRPVLVIYPTAETGIQLHHIGPGPLDGHGEFVFPDHTQLRVAQRHAAHAERDVNPQFPAHTPDIPDAQHTHIESESVQLRLQLDECAHLPVLVVHHGPRRIGVQIPFIEEKRLHGHLSAVLRRQRNEACEDAEDQEA